MQYESTRFDYWDLIGTIGTCDYCGREISECVKYERAWNRILCSQYCFVQYCYDRGIKCEMTKNMVEF
jgi:hypothetical protein